MTKCFACRRMGCWTMAILLLLVHLQTATEIDDGSAFVQEVLEEDADDFSTMNPDNAYEADMLRQREEAEKRFYAQQAKRQEQIDERERENKDQIRRDREQAFEAALAKMSDDKAKAARKQKKRDAAVAKKVIKAAEAGNLYAVLGLRNNRSLIIPGRSVTVIPGYFVLHIPELRLFYVSSMKIKRAYRDMAKRVHPDKSKDGRAVEAFYAVENAASILLEESNRALYDRDVLLARRERIAKVTNYVGIGVDRSYRLTNRALGIVRSFLGPFALPVLILSALIF